jgi:hypothetical protein
VALIVVASLGSIVVNYGRVVPLASVVLKGVVGFLAIVEQRTGFNVFDHLRSVLPLLEFQGSTSVVRNGLLRAFGSADHPIALGVLFAMTVPLGIALAMSRSSAWWAPTLLIMIGVLASASRTPVLAIVTAIIAFLILRPRDFLPLLPLTIPLLIVIKIAAPGSIVTLVDSFFPQAGFVAEQRTLAADPTLISGRANFKPRLIEGMSRPILGQGLGTRQTGADNPLRNAPILDNQWLGTFLDVGLLGIVGWLWLITRIVRQLGRIARPRGSPDGLIAAGFVASITGFAVGMLTYDTFAFIQETIIFWVVLALAATLVRAHRGPVHPTPQPAA